MAIPKTLQQAREAMQDSNTALIDIRTAEEYAKQHIPGSRNIEASILPDQLEQLKQHHTIICICNHGHKRSQGAADTLTASGLENVYFLEGGVGGWFQ